MTENQADLPAGARCAVHADTPARVTCSRCGNFACEACETRSESNAIVCKSCDEQGSGGVIPWEEREKLGVPRAFFQTALAVVIRPWELFAARPREASILPAILFGWLVGIPTTLLGGLVNLLSMESQRAQLLANPYTREMVWMAEPAFLIGTSLGSLLLYPLIVVFYAVLWHLPLLMFAAAKRPFTETMRALAYVHATYLPMIAVLPVVAILNVLGLQTLGAFLLFPFSIYVWVWAGIAMWRVHRCDGWRVFAAAGAQIVTIVALSCLCASLLVVAMMQTMAIPGLR